MRNKYHFLVYCVVLGCALGIIIFGCDSGVGTSSEPGILSIVLQSEPSDTSVIIVVDTLSVAPTDSFGVTIFQGKAYDDSVYAILYTDLRSTQQEDIVYNIIKIENGEYKKFTIFESYVPPGEYNKIHFGLKSSILKFSGFDEITVETPDEFRYVDLFSDFSVSENKVTEINVQISPFKSISRYKDTYHFNPEVDIISVIYH